MEQRKEPLTEEQIVEIQDDVGNCWHELGTELRIEEAKLRNLERDYNYCRQRAYQVLQMWMDQNGRDATVGRLACALIARKQKRIAERLLGM